MSRQLGCTVALAGFLFSMAPAAAFAEQLCVCADGTTKYAMDDFADACQEACQVEGGGTPVEDEQGLPDEVTPDPTTPDPAAPGN